MPGTPRLAVKSSSSRNKAGGGGVARQAEASAPLDRTFWTHMVERERKFTPAGYPLKRHIQACMRSPHNKNASIQNKNKTKQETAIKTAAPSTERLRATIGFTQETWSRMAFMSILG